MGSSSRWLRSTFKATRRPSDSCSASYTTPIPPRPTSRKRWKSPSRSTSFADPGGSLDRRAPGDVARAGLEVFHQPKHREELADLAGQIGIARGVFLQRRPLAPAAALEELLGELLDRRSIW